MNFNNYHQFIFLALMVVVFLFSLFLTNVLRKLAISNNVLDIPNSRSSHITPTPRGGGLAFVIGFLFLLPGILFFNLSDKNTIYSLFFAGLLIAGIGLYDDFKYISVKKRMFIHLSAALMVLYFMHGMPDFEILTYQIHTGFFANILGVFYLVWLTNLYNFMDGIDAIAGVETLCTCIGISTVYLLTSNHALLYLPLTLAASVAGFLYWNKPPAKIFMGDVGSGFLGLILGILSLQATKIDKNFLWSWLILLGVFIIDASFTLCFRLFKGEKIFKAHSAHTYQKLARKLNSHSLVTFIVLIINILWLYPWAILVGREYLNGFLGLVIAYVPLFILVFILQMKLS